MCKARTRRWASDIEDIRIRCFEIRDWTLFSGLRNYLWVFQSTIWWYATHKLSLMISFLPPSEPASRKLWRKDFKLSLVIFPGKPQRTTLRPSLDKPPLAPLPVIIPRFAASCRPPAPLVRCRMLCGGSEDAADIGIEETVAFFRAWMLKFR